MAVKNTKEFYVDFMKLHLEGGLKRGFSTGWKAIDEYYSVNPGELTIVTGIPNSGKSEWMDALMVNLAKNHGFKWIVFSPENYPISSHIAKITEKVVGKPFSAGKHKPMAMDDADNAARWMYEHFDFIDQGLDGLNVDQLVDDISGWASAIDADIPLGAVIDPWNEIDISRGNDSEPEFINKALSKFRRMAREFKVTLFIVAHPTKLQRDKDGNYPCPTPYDISGAAHFRNKADVCIAVHRDMGNPACTTEVHIQKVRGKHIGKMGMAELKWDRLTGRYTELIGDYEDVRG